MRRNPKASNAPVQPARGCCVICWWRRARRRPKHDEQLKQFYRRLLPRRGKARAKVAVARKLLIRCFIMGRAEIDYAEFLRRGQERDGVKRQWAVDLSGEGRRSGSLYSYLYADWTVDLFFGRVRILLHERCCCSHRWLLSLRCDSDYEVNAGTRKTARKKARTQKQKQSIRCDHTNKLVSETHYWVLGGKNKNHSAPLGRVRSFFS